MSYSGMFWHLAGFLAPALAVALLMGLLVRLLGWRGRVGPAMRLAAGVAACVLASLLGLVLAGEDGRMETYALLALAGGVTHALLVRPRKR